MADGETQFAALPPFSPEGVSPDGILSRRGEEFKSIIHDSEAKIRQERIEDTYLKFYRLSGLFFRRKNFKRRFDVESVFQEITSQHIRHPLGDYISQKYSQLIEKYAQNDRAIDEVFSKIDINGSNFLQMKKMVHDTSFPNGWKQPSLFTCVFKIFKAEQLTKGDLTTLSTSEIHQFSQYLDTLIVLYAQKISILEQVFLDMQQDEKILPYMQELVVEQKDTTEMIIPGISFMYGDKVYDVFYKYNFCIVAGEQNGDTYKNIRLFSLKNKKIEAYEDMQTYYMGKMEFFRVNVGGRVRFFTLDEQGKPNFFLPFGLQSISSIEKTGSYGDGQEVYKLRDGVQERYFLIDASENPPRLLEFEGMQSFVNVIFPPGGRYAIFQGKTKSAILDVKRGYLVGVGTQEKLYSYLKYIPTENMVIVKSDGKYKLMNMNTGISIAFYPQIKESDNSRQYSEFYAIQYKGGVFQLTTLDGIRFFVNGKGEEVSYLFGNMIFVQ